MISKLAGFELDQVHSGDCIDNMRSLPSNSFDVAIADPPYNLSKGNVWKWDNSVKLPGFGGDWSKMMAGWDDMDLLQYVQFSLAWLSEVKRLVKPTGSFWVHGTYHNIGLINFCMQLLEIEIINEVIWYKRNSFPNLSGRRLTASHETILWAHTGTSKNRKYLFAYDRSKNSPFPEDALKEQGKQMRTVWDIPNNKKPEEIRFGKHPSQKPVRLLTRMLLISAEKDTLLLVPFAGAGSECIAAKDLNIHFIAFENETQYIDTCNKRLAHFADKDPIFTFQHRSATAHATHNRGGLNAAIPRCHHSNDSHHFPPRAETRIPSLIKWTGSKRSQALSIAKLMPDYRNYIEPFLGGGAILFLAAIPGAIAGDIYRPLIELWKSVQNQPDAVVDDYETRWHALTKELDTIDASKVKPTETLPIYYYEIRKAFNVDQDPLKLNFLMRTCVNGIARFNDKGDFNNSFHLSRRGMTPARFKSIVETWHDAIQGVNFVCQDYKQTLDQATTNDFVYLDPPYAGCKQRYVQTLDLSEFFAQLDLLNRKHVKWALSFDGIRGSQDLKRDVPMELFKRHLLLPSGNSAVKKVLSGPIESVHESLYLNY